MTVMSNDGRQRQKIKIREICETKYVTPHYYCDGGNVIIHNTTVMVAMQ